MRILTLTLLIVCLTPLAGTAQTTLHLKTQMGYAWQNSNNEFFLTTVDHRILPHFGFSAEVFRSLTPKLALGVAPGYMRRGTAFERGFINGLVVGPIPSFDARLNLNYLQLPFLLKYEKVLGQKLSVAGRLGAGFAYLLGGFREVRFFGTDTPRERQDLDFSDTDQDINRFDFGWSSGIDLGYSLVKGKILLSFDYYHGLLDADQKVVSQNRNWGVGLGYCWNISKKT